MSSVDQRRIQEISMKVTLAAAVSSSREVRDAAHHMKPVVELLESLISRIEKLEKERQS